jgi:hypothetical protein
MATHLEHQRLERILLGQHQLVDEVHQLLEQEQKQDDIIRAVVLSSRGRGGPEWTNPPEQRVFSEDSIRAMCVKYRLRFLEGALFKGAIPDQAVYAVRQVERRLGEPLHAFRIMAPAARFRLCDSETDPLLFLALADGRYVLLHKWGHDLSPWRALMGWPVRHAANLAATVLLVAAILSLLAPDAWLGGWHENRFLVFVWTSLVLASFTVFGWFAFFGQFSTDNWNSRYFN